MSALEQALGPAIEVVAKATRLVQEWTSRHQDRARGPITEHLDLFVLVPCNPPETPRIDVGIRKPAS